MRNRHHVSRGFTFIELLISLVIVGVLAVIILPRFNTRGFDEAAFAQETATALRYAQRLAVNSRCPVQVRVDATNERLDLYYPDGTAGAACGPADPPSFGNDVTVPGVRGGAYAVAAEPGVDVTAGFVLYFDALGRPVPGGGVASVGGHTVTVEDVTGYVH